MLLSIILPIRVTEKRIDLIHQIENIFLDKKFPENIEIIIVDDGSSNKYSKEIKLKCQKHNIKYLYLNTFMNNFSLARARNEGAKVSLGKFIMFQDIDMMPYDGFYNDILLEIKAQDLYNKPTLFIMIGTIYLTQKGTNSFLPTLKQYFIDKLFIEDEEYIERYSTATSLIILHKKQFNLLGGYNEKFEKWGHEDIEFNCRLILKDNTYPLPKEFTLDEKNFNNIFEYKGWKSIYRLYGDRTFLKGIVLFHAWHPSNQEDDYYSNRTKNKEYFQNSLKKIILKHQNKLNYQISKSSLLFDRYKYSGSSSNRLKCKSFLFTLYEKIRKIF